MTTRLLKLALVSLSTLAAPVFAQTPGPETTATIPRPVHPAPEVVLYGAFFFRVTWFDSRAGKQTEAGDYGGRLHSALRGAKLNSSEETAVALVAKDYREKCDAVLDAARAKLADGKSGEAMTIAKEREALVLSHIEQLRALLGDSSFQRLDGYVRSWAKGPAVQAAPRGR